MVAYIGTSVVALAALATGCNEQTVCTLEFAYVVLKVQDTQGAAVTGLAISDTIVRTDQGFAVPQDLPFLDPGTYVVLSDDHTTLIRSGPQQVRVAGTKNGITAFTADFLFDAPNGCHVRKLAGPSTVVVGS